MPIKPNHVGSGVETRAQKHIVIIGGGFAGIAAARALKRAPAEVVLIDPSVPTMLRQSPAGSLPLRAEVKTSHGYAPCH